MLVLKLEMHSAITGEVREIGRTVIYNKGGSHERGEYGVAVCRRGSTDYHNKPTRVGEVLNYPRLSYNVWRLVIRSLLSAFPEETK